MLRLLAVLYRLQASHTVDVVSFSDCLPPIAYLVLLFAGQSSAARLARKAAWLHIPFHYYLSWGGVGYYLVWVERLENTLK